MVSQKMLSPYIPQNGEREKKKGVGWNEMECIPLYFKKF